MDLPAPSFDGPMLLGSGQARIDVNAGSVTVVSFWASWCTECRSEAPQLDALWRSFRQRGVRFVGVDYEDQMSAAVQFARSNGIEYPTVRDPNGRVGDAYGIFGLPTTFIVSSEGRIRYQITGALDVAAFTAELRTLTREEDA
jgi:cytochrome c biogenesis protein CcmG, thiol:disulfide interchange protein DsbE